MGIFSLICLILAFGALGFFIFKMVKIVKNHVIGQEKYKIAGNEKILLLGLVCACALLFLTSSITYVIFKGYSLKFLEFFVLIVGALFMGATVPFAVGSFILYYYKTDLDDKQRNVCKFGWPIAIVAFFLGVLLLTEGVANHIIYPLVSGLSFTQGWIRAGENGGGFTVKFYGVIIVTGALICYAITDHEMYKKFKKHGLIDTLFIVVFLFGILGARLWFCLILEPDMIREAGFLYIFIGIVDGGLAIQGGAIAGLIAAVVFMLLFRKYIDLRFLLDVAAPTVLIAQALGRWGNFFNQEVYGAVTSIENLWYLPTIVKNNMLIDGHYRIPLFFIEGVMNIGGYFIIRYLVGKVFKAHLGLGVQACSYFTWYGLTRVVLEPLREGFTLKLGHSAAFGYLQSWITAFVMMAVGIIGIIVCVFIHKHRMKLGKEDAFGDKI